MRCLLDLPTPQRMGTWTCIPHTFPLQKAQSRKGCTDSRSVTGTEWAEAGSYRIRVRPEADSWVLSRGEIDVSGRERFFLPSPCWGFWRVSVLQVSITSRVHTLGRLGGELFDEAGDHKFWFNRTQLPSLTNPWSRRRPSA